MKIRIMVFISLLLYITRFIASFSYLFSSYIIWLYKYFWQKNIIVDLTQKRNRCRPCKRSRWSYHSPSFRIASLKENSKLLDSFVVGEVTLILWDLLSDTTQQIKGIMELPRHPCAYMNKGNFNSETFSGGKYSNNAL